MATVFRSVNLNFHLYTCFSAYKIGKSYNFFGVTLKTQTSIQKKIGVPEIRRKLETFDFWLRSTHLRSNVQSSANKVRESLIYLNGRGNFRSHPKMQTSRQNHAHLVFLTAIQYVSKHVRVTTTKP